MEESENKLKDIHKTWDASCRRVIREVKECLKEKPGYVIVMEEPKKMFYRIDHIILEDGMLLFCRLNTSDVFVMREEIASGVVGLLICLTENLNDGKYALVEKTINLNGILNQ